MSDMAHDVSARITEWKLSTNDIQTDINAKRDIVRTKTNAGAPTGNIDKSALKSAVESRVHGDSQLAPFKLDVEIDHQTEVVLTGKARTADEIGRAIAVALDTEGVTKVTSKIKLDKNAGS
jgi:osmotically-inducible protein OsmY